MDKKELIFQALSEYSCVTTKELSNYIKRTYNKSITPASIAGMLKIFIKDGSVKKSDCGVGTHYWIAD